MASAAKILLIFKYQTTDRMKQGSEQGYKPLLLLNWMHVCGGAGKEGERKQRGRAPEGPGSWTLKHRSREQQ